MSNALKRFMKDPSGSNKQVAVKPTSVNILVSQHEFIAQHGLNLSKMIREYLEKIIKEEKEKMGKFKELSISNVEVSQGLIQRTVSKYFTVESTFSLYHGSLQAIAFSIGEPSDDLVQFKIIWNCPRDPEVAPLQGLHLSSGFDSVADFEYRIKDAVEVCIRDGFKTIYIYKNS